MWMVAAYSGLKVQVSWLDLRLVAIWIHQTKWLNYHNGYAMTRAS